MMKSRSGSSSNRDFVLFFIVIVARTVVVLAAEGPSNNSSSCFIVVFRKETIDTFMTTERSVQNYKRAVFQQDNGQTTRRKSKPMFTFSSDLSFFYLKQ